MKIRIIGLPAIALSLLIGACTHRPVHPTKTEREWAADHKACERWARAEVRDELYAYDTLDEMKMIKSCMKQKGWTWEWSSGFRSKTESAE
jgi:hypothetical protein